MDDDDSVSEELAMSAVVQRAAEAMRADVPMSPAWRNKLLHDVANIVLTERPRPVLWQRTITLRPLAALAACLLAVAAGAASVIALGKLQTTKPSSGVAETTARNSTANPVGAGNTIIRFALVAPGAARVSVVGDFNGWNAKATPNASGSGRSNVDSGYAAVVGRHLYAFVVDGDLVADPAAPRVVDDDFGVQNSVVLVGASRP